MSLAVSATTLPALLDAISVAIGHSGQTQKALAKAVGLSEKHVSQMMTGRVDGSLRSWQALLEAAGLSMTATILPAATPSATPPRRTT